MKQIITSDLVESYSLCPRKAFLLMAGVTNLGLHEYMRIIDEQAASNRQVYRTSLVQAGELPPGGVIDLNTGSNVLSDAELIADGVLAHCDFLMKVNEPSRLGMFCYEPVKVIGTCRATKADFIGIAYEGLVLGEVQGKLPALGTLVRLDARLSKVKLAAKYREVRRIVDALRFWADNPTSDAPLASLNKHCPVCPFRDACLQQAERDDNLSLLDHMTPKLMRKCHNKGIFTVRQLSHVYKPRRSRKKAKRQVRHSLELQALAIRMAKVYVEHLPELQHGPVDLVVDLEGVPDRGYFYLAGLLVCKAEDTEYQPFWADDEKDEAAMWSALVERLEAFPDSPIYHYGDYERKAFATLAKRHGKGSGLADHLVNVVSSVYGKVYFPVRSNGLKSLGRFLGAAWTDPQASGLQSLVWRHRWETTRDEQYRHSLMQYNREDCEAVRLLVDRLCQINKDAASDPSIEFASRPKRHTTETGNVVHGQFERILRSAHQDSAGTIRVRPGDADLESGPRKRGSKKGHQAFCRITPKVSRIVIVPPMQRCPKCHNNLTPDKGTTERTVIDLIFTRNGCRKTITKYMGQKAYCPKCVDYYSPPSLQKFYNSAFGHGLQAWIVYQRIVLRLPYRIITQVTEHLFGVGMSDGTIVSYPWIPG